MCIMEVREGQHSSTIAQACAHNTNTVIGDLDMFEALLRKRIDHLRAHDTAAAATREEGIYRSVRSAHEELRKAYAQLMDVFGEEVSGEVTDRGDHHGTERVPTEVLAAQAHHDTRLARRYMTR